MKMTAKISAILLGATLFGAVGPGAFRANAQEMDAETKARVERFEKGPATIDVSKYPDAIKEYYGLFSHIS